MSLVTEVCSCGARIEVENWSASVLTDWRRQHWHEPPADVSITGAGTPWVALTGRHKPPEDAA